MKLKNNKILKQLHKKKKKKLRKKILKKFKKANKLMTQSQLIY